MACNHNSRFYEKLTVPLLHRILDVEELALYLVLNTTQVFIDGNNLKKNIIDPLPNLKRLVFNIRSNMYVICEAY